MASNRSLALRVDVDPTYGIFSWSAATLPERWLSSFSLDAMRRTASFIVTGACLFLSSACDRARGPHLPRYEVTYYDRNHDGIADLEFHHAPGWADADWGFVDSDYKAEYD